MKRLALLLALICTSAGADVWTLYKGTAIVKPRVDYATLQACSAAVPKKASGSYTCRAIIPVPVPVPVEPPHVHGGIPVDMTGWPVQTMAMASDDRLSSGNPIPPLSAAGDEGAFRTVCGWTHMSFDDPIVYPGQPGAAHHHTFYGNTMLDAATTPENIRTRGASSCRGGTVNLTGYWHPSLIDGVTHRPLAPEPLIVYYKNILGPYVSLGQSPTEPLPDGLRMITGTASNGGPQAAGSGVGNWSCLVNPGTGNATERAQGQTIPVCAPGEWLRVKIDFRQCWNGQLDSPDHKSHLADHVRNWPGTAADPYDPYKPMVCPLTHPRMLPIITIIAQWQIPAGTDYAKLRVSSDTYDAALPGGYSFHADWFNGWKPDISKLWGDNCMTVRRDCGSATLGDGRNLIEWAGN